MTIGAADRNHNLPIDTGIFPTSTARHTGIPARREPPGPPGSSVTGEPGGGARAGGLRAVVAGGGPASRCVGRPARPGGRRSGPGGRGEPDAPAGCALAGIPYKKAVTCEQRSRAGCRRWLGDGGGVPRRTARHGGEGAGGGRPAAAATGPAGGRPLRRRPGQVAQVKPGRAGDTVRRTPPGGMGAGLAGAP